MTSRRVRVVSLRRWWERARLELVDHNVVVARGSLGAMLEITRDPELRRRVTETLGALPTG